MCVKSKPVPTGVALRRRSFLFRMELACATSFGRGPDQRPPPGDGPPIQGADGIVRIAAAHEEWRAVRTRACNLCKCLVGVRLIVRFSKVFRRLHAAKVTLRLLGLAHRIVLASTESHARQFQSNFESLNQGFRKIFSGLNRHLDLDDLSSLERCGSDHVLAVPSQHVPAD